jgi:hypothetical protein
MVSDLDRFIKLFSTLDIYYIYEKESYCHNIFIQDRNNFYDDIAILQFNNQEKFIGMVLL